jgi:hypothetical protein
MTVVIDGLLTTNNFVQEKIKNSMAFKRHNKRTRP